MALAGAAAGAAAQRGGPADSCTARFYERRGLRPAWTDSTGVSQQAAFLLAALTQAGQEGLDPADYGAAAIDSLLQRTPWPADAWRLDSLLTHAFFAYGWDVSRGRVSPSRVDTLWTAAPYSTDLVGLLDAALDSGRVADILRGLAPPQPGYAALVRALARYRGVMAQGGWPVVPAGPPLTIGAQGDRVLLLRRRLEAEGYAPMDDSGGDRFGGGLEAAVGRFQALHGLDPDGVVGSATRTALNVPAAARARQIALNLERWRWLPRSLGERYAVVNAAAFTLDVVEHGQRVGSLRAIVGRHDWPTPIVSSTVTDLVFRPLWNVPRAIAVSEVLPLLRRDPRYFARVGMRLFGPSAAGWAEIDPATVDWTTVTESTFTYQLVQEPGPDNPLGGVKLLFWTPFNVFIHDTPARPLFSERWRAFSHGCVRVEGAAELAAYLLPDWPADSIHAAMSSGRERRVPVPAPLPVHLVYWTAWTDGDGGGGGGGPVEFRADTYGWDRRLAAALAATRPIAVSAAASTRP